MKLVIIFGPQAVGKMTVGKELSKFTGYKLLHNHISIEVALQFFEWATPEFKELDKTIRYKIFELVKRSNNNLIFTFTWGLDLESDTEYISNIISEYSNEVYFVELTASQKTRLARNDLPDRLDTKPSKRNIELSRSLIIDSEQKYRFNTKNDFPYHSHLIIDTEKYNPKEAVRIISNTFDL